MQSIFSHRILPDLRPSLFHKSLSVILKTGSHALATFLGYRKRAKKNANTLSYRTESLDFFDVSESLRGVSLLFLTDPHIGGNIDALATEISRHIHTLLGDAHPEKTLVLHGGDFVCSASGDGMTTETNFLEVSTKLFHGLSRYPQFGVIGNHDDSNHHFVSIRSHLESTHEITLLETPEDAQRVKIDGATVSIHGIHTLSTLLHNYSKLERERLLDNYIVSLNAD